LTVRNQPIKRNCAAIDHRCKQTAISASGYQFCAAAQPAKRPCHSCPKYLKIRGFKAFCREAIKANQPTFYSAKELMSAAGI
jgi:hypothetical protein